MANFVIDDYQIVIRLLIAAVLGALIGYERERQNQPAGLRTHMIMVVGSTLAMTISINLAMQFRPVAPNGDPARLAAQVVSGIGFLGAGAILRFGVNIRGLTTATSLWTMAIVGLAIGAGHYFAGIITTLLLLIVLAFLDEVERRFIKTYKTVTVNLTLEDHPEVLNEVRNALVAENTSLIGTSINKDLMNDQVNIELVLKTQENAPIEHMVDHIVHLKGLRSYKIA